VSGELHDQGRHRWRHRAGRGPGLRRCGFRSSVGDRSRSRLGKPDFFACSTWGIWCASARCRCWAPLWAPA